MTLDDLRQRHPDQERIDREAAALLRATDLAQRCNAFDLDTCPWCDHYLECAAAEQDMPPDIPKRSKRQVLGETPARRNPNEP